MAEVFMCPVGALTTESREMLIQAGVVVVECDDPDRCRFVRAGEIVSSDDMLWAAVAALKAMPEAHGAKVQREVFANNMFEIINAARNERRGQRKKPEPPK